MATRETLTDSVAVITGASSGIGRATALALARAGARVALAARRRERLEEVAAEVSAMGGQALVLPTDVTRQEQVERLVAATVERWGRLDWVIASAGLYVRCPVTQLSPAEVERSMAVNFYGPLYLVLASLPHLLRQGRGHIFLVTSLDGKKGLPPDGPYVAAKFALSGLGEVMRQELRDTGVHVTILFPGRVDTPMIEDLQVPWISAKVPPEAVARAILRAIRRPRPEIVVPPYAKALVYLNLISPRLGDWAVRHFRLEGWEAEK